MKNQVDKIEVTEQILFDEADRLKKEFNELSVLLSTLSVGLGLCEEPGEILELIHDNPSVSAIEQFYGMPIILEYYIGKYIDRAKDLDNIYYLYESLLKEEGHEEENITEKLDALYNLLESITTLPDEEYYLAVYNYDGNEYDVREDDPELRS